MAVQDEASFKRYAANGIATVYAIPFLLLNTADLRVALNGADVVSGFTVSGIGSNTGSITFDVAPTGDLLLQRVVPFERLADYQDNGDLLARTVNLDFDRIWLALQELRRDDSGALRVNILEPEGIDPLPLVASRALRALGFDAQGRPVVSNLTLAQLEQQPAGAAASAAAAQQSANEAAAFRNAAALAASSSAQSAGESGVARDEAQEIANSLAGSALPMFAVLWWPSRTQIPAGFAAADGQLLSRASFPQAWTGIAGNQVPIALDVNWLNNPIHRGRYTAGDGSTTFRLPDYNGAYAGSLGGLFLRGSPTLGVAGNTVLDAFQGHKFDLAATGGAGILGNSAVGTGPAGNGNGVSLTGAQAWATRMQTAAAPTSDGTNGTPRVADETRPLHVQGVWIIKLFGAAVETGTVNVPQLASDVVALTSRVTVLEGQRQTDRLRLHTDALWSGNVGSNGVALALSSPIAVGDLLFLRHTNADRSVSHPLVVTEGMMTAGRTAQWSFSSGGYTGLTYNSPTQFTTNGFTSGFGLSEIYRSKAGL